MTSDELHDLLRQVWNREISADHAFGDLEPVVYDEARLRHDIKVEVERSQKHQELLEQMIDEWECRGKHRYRDGAPAIIFKIRNTIENEPR